MVPHAHVRSVPEKGVLEALRGEGLSLGAYSEKLEKLGAPRGVKTSHLWFSAFTGSLRSPVGWGERTN